MWWGDNEVKTLSGGGGILSTNIFQAARTMDETGASVERVGIFNCPT